MSSLQQTTSRINSITSTKKITNAMKLVATAKLRTARINYEQGIPYATTVEKVMNSVSRIMEADKYCMMRDEGVDLYIVISSELGLCGAYNLNMFKLVPTDVKLVLLGKQATTHFKNHDVLYEKTGITDQPNIDDLRAISAKIFKMYDNHELRSVNIVYTKYLSSISFEPTVERIFPFSRSGEAKKNVEFEPNEQGILQYTVPRYLLTKMTLLMLESLVSEYASRRLAMENATDNANELIEQLMLEKNRARQAAITQEISEIIAGAEAL